MAEPPVVLPRNAPVPHAGPPGRPPPLPAHGLWAQQQGADLVVPNGALLPDVCVKCGAREGLLRRHQKFVYTPPWVFLLALVNLIVMAVVAMVTQKRGALALPICPRCHGRWRMAVVALGFSIAWIFLGLIFGGIAFANEIPVLGALLMASAIGAPIGVGVGLVRPRIVKAKKIKDLLMTLGGVHPAAIAAAVEAAQRPNPPALPASEPAPSGSIAT